MTHTNQFVKLPRSSQLRTMDVSSHAEDIQDGTKGHVVFNGKVVSLVYDKGHAAWLPQGKK